MFRTCSGRRLVPVQSLQRGDREQWLRTCASLDDPKDVGKPWEKQRCHPTFKWGCRTNRISVWKLFFWLDMAFIEICFWYILINGIRETSLMKTWFSGSIPFRIPKRALIIWDWMVNIVARKKCGKVGNIPIYSNIQDVSICNMYQQVKIQCYMIVLKICFALFCFFCGKWFIVIYCEHDAIL